VSRDIAAAAAAVIAAALAVTGCWLAGYDFDERGPAAVAAFVLSVVFGAFAWIAVWTYPGWADDPASDD